MRAKKVASGEHGARVSCREGGRAGNARATIDGFGAMAGKEARDASQAAKVLGVTQTTRVGSEEGQNQPIQHELVGTVGSSRWTQTQTEARGVSG